MNDPGAMHDCEGAPDLSRVINGGVLVEHSPSTQDGLGKGFPFDQFHDQVGSAVLVWNDISDRHD